MNYLQRKLIEWKAKEGLLATMKEKQELKDDIKRLRPRITYRGTQREYSSKPLKVIPLKLFYYETFFETWRNQHS